MATRPDFTLTLEARGMTPEVVSVGELSSILSKLAAAVRDEAWDDDIPDRPQTVRGRAPKRKQFQPEPAEISLVEVREGSSAYGFACRRGCRRSAHRIIDALASRSLGRIAPVSQKRVVQLVNRYTAKGVTVRFTYPDGPDAVIPAGSDKLVVNKNQLIRGTTEQLVNVVTVGGTKPAARVRLLGPDKRLLPVRGEKKAIADLGRLLYTNAVISGTGWWRMPDMELVDFYIHGSAPAPDANLKGVFEQLADLVRQSGADLTPDTDDEDEPATGGPVGGAKG